MTREDEIWKIWWIECHQNKYLSDILDEMFLDYETYHCICEQLICEKRGLA